MPMIAFKIKEEGAFAVLSSLLSCMLFSKISFGFRFYPENK
jgi:hypothetical protein